MRKKSIKKKKLSKNIKKSENEVHKTEEAPHEND